MYKSYTVNSNAFHNYQPVGNGVQPSFTLLQFEAASELLKIKILLRYW